ncbi:hypothetical protein CB1_000877005 [Camelus ferus]|nr:hypothetical protein CB1_000877005 [Camelus ferus]
MTACRPPARPPAQLTLPRVYLLPSGNRTGGNTPCSPRNGPYPAPSSILLLRPPRHKGGEGFLALTPCEPSACVYEQLLEFKVLWSPPPVADTMLPFTSLASLSWGLLTCLMPLSQVQGEDSLPPTQGPPTEDAQRDLPSAQISCKRGFVPIPISGRCTSLMSQRAWETTGREDQSAPTCSKALHVSHSIGISWLAFPVPSLSSTSRDHGGLISFQDKALTSAFCLVLCAPDTPLTFAFPSLLGRCFVPRLAFWLQIRTCACIAGNHQCPAPKFSLSAAFAAALLHFPRPITEVFLSGRHRVDSTDGSQPASAAEDCPPSSPWRSVWALCDGGKARRSPEPIEAILAGNGVLSAAYLSSFTVRAAFKGPKENLKKQTPS